MGVTTATLAGNRVMTATVTLPKWGAWYADAECNNEVTLSGQVDLKINDLTLSGTVLSGGPGHGRSVFRIVGGKAGLGRALPGKSYADDLGVKVSKVLGDALSAAGETLDASTVPATRLGPAWARAAGPARQVLEQIAPAGWYVDVDGVIRIGARPTKTYTDKAPRVTPMDRAYARVTLAADVLAPLVPGAVVDGLEAVDVVHEVGPHGLRTTVHGALGGNTSRALSSLRDLIEQLDPARKYRAVYEYRVGERQGNRLGLQPALVSTGMPDLQRVPVRPGVSGVKADVPLGSLVLVGFVNADPARPVVLAFEDADGDGFDTDSLTLASGNTPDPTGGLGRVVRYGDPIVFATPGPGVVSAGAVLTNFSKVKA